MRDALADLLQTETQYAPVTDAQGRIAGVLSVEIISEFLVSPEAKVEEHAAVERPQRRMSSRSPSSRPLLGAGRDPQPHRRATPPARPQNKAFCFGWAVDNFDRYTTPLLNQLLLVAVAVAIGFAIAFAMALISHAGAG